MEFDFEMTMLETEEKMDKAINSYKMNLAKISAGRANPQLLDAVKMEYYGSPTPINQVANISVPEPRQLLIKPFDISTNKDIVAAINNANLGIQAVDEGDKTRMTFPELTTERRRQLVKSLAQYTEQARVQVRSARQDANKAIKGADSLPEDVERRMQDDVQKITDKYIAIIDETTKAKEQELMTI